MANPIKCGTGSYRNAAYTVAIIDTIFSSILLILFVLGSSVLVAFEFVGNRPNATKVLDEITDDLFGGNNQANYSISRQTKDIAEDMGVYVMFMSLAIIDFIISYVFLDGVKSKNLNKLLCWLSVRIVIIIVFLIVVAFNIFYGAQWSRYSAESIFAVYRIISYLIGYGYFKELRDLQVCGNCNCPIRRPSNNCGSNVGHSIINLAFKRKEAKSSMALEPPIVTITGPEENGRTTPLFIIPSSRSSPSVSRLNSTKGNTLSV